MPNTVSRARTAPLERRALRLLFEARPEEVFASSGKTLARGWVPYSFVVERLLPACGPVSVSVARFMIRMAVLRLEEHGAVRTQRDLIGDSDAFRLAAV